MTKQTIKFYSDSAKQTQVYPEIDPDTLSDYQETLVSGENIKTINNQSILGEGNISISGGGGTIPNASATVVGGIKILFDTSTNTLYISNDGTDLEENE